MDRGLKTIIEANVLKANTLNLNIIGRADEKYYEPIEGYFTLNASKLDGEDVLN